MGAARIPLVTPAPGSASRLAAAVTDRRTVHSPDGTAISVLVATPPPEVPAAALPPVLAVHGFASSAVGNWQRAGHLDTLIRAGRTVIAPDLRGHGRSDRPHTTDAYSLPAVLADLLAAVTAGPEADDRAVTGPLDGAPSAGVDLIGYSLGARLCWALACRHLLPVRRMVLGGFDGRALFEGVDTEALDQLAADGGDNDRVALRHLVAGLAGTGGVGPGDPLPDVPTLVVAGDRDPLAGRAADFAALLPRGAFLPVAGRNHISTVPAQAFRYGARDFLAG